MRLFLSVVCGLLLSSEAGEGPTTELSLLDPSRGWGLPVVWGSPVWPGGCLAGFLNTPFIWARWIGHCLGPA